MSEISIVAVLDDPVRRRLYEYVALQPHGVSRSRPPASSARWPRFTWTGWPRPGW